jgi:hypothetical protein
VSYALRFADKAIVGLQALEPWLQEETLDEIDRLVDAPPTILRRRTGSYVLDVVRDRGSNRFYVFVTVFRESPQVLQISEIGHHVGRLP